MREFNTVGFARTNTNQIARSAGFAPQTFYRHFDNKLEAFIEIYHSWRTEEQKMLSPLMGKSDLTPQESARIATRVILDHHREWAVFRQSLRILTLTEPLVREARALSRMDQAMKQSHLPKHEAISLILEIETLCDAAIDGTIQELGLDPELWIQLIEDRIANRLSV